MKNWCNIDNYPLVADEKHRGSEVKPDLWLDLNHEEFGQDLLDIIYSSHVFEHFTYRQSLALLSKCHTSLKPGGYFVAEMPDLASLCFFYTFFGSRGPRALGSTNHSFISSQFYGASWESSSSDFSHHRYVWSKIEFSRVCRSLGFEIVLLSNRTLSHCPGRDFVIVCKKPNYTLLSQNNEDVEVWIRRYGKPEYASFFSGLACLKLLFKLITYDVIHFLDVRK